MSSQSDVDWFKVLADAGDEVVVKISCKNAVYQNYMFHIETFDPSMMMLNSYNRVINEEESSFEVQVNTYTTSGWYYIKVSFNKTPIFFYGGDLMIQAFINGEPVSGIESVYVSHTECQYFDLRGTAVDPNYAKNQILIQKKGNISTKIFMR